jgi:hypothetical protein
MVGWGMAMTMGWFVANTFFFFFSIFSFHLLKFVLAFQDL